MRTAKENVAMRCRWKFGAAGLILGLSALVAPLGCYHGAVEEGDLDRGPAPLRMPSPVKGNCCYEDSLTGGQIFDIYCNYCHNAPAVSERPFSNFQNVAAHMRVRANLTGKEYDKLVLFLRRWADVGPPHPPIEPSPKRFIYSQPIAELQSQSPKKEEAAKP
jgi:hypothetical protein